MSLSWCLYLVLMLLSSPSPLSTLAPENEVPLRPTTWLSEGKMTPVHLVKGRTRRLHFTLRKKTTALTVTVSPCSATIEWSLKACTVKDKPAKSAYWNTKKSVPEMWWKGSGYEAVIHTYTGGDVDTYTGPAYDPSAIYTICLKSREQDTQVAVHLHEGPAPSGVFPELPRDPHVHTLGVGLTSVTLRWAPSSSVTQPSHHSQKVPYEYCVLVNHKQNYRSLCAARVGLRKQQERETKLRRKKQRREASRPNPKDWWSWQQWDYLEGHSSSAVIKSSNSEDLGCACREVESVCTVSDLLPDTQYYFDVFVIDRVNGTSAAYTGTSAHTHPEALPTVVPLREGQEQWVTLIAGSDNRQRYSFRPRGWQQNGLLTLQSCNATCKAKVSISSKGKLLSSQEVDDQLAQIWLQGGSSYLIQLQALETTSSPKLGPGQSKVCLKMQASSAYHRRAAPALPATLQIKSFNKLRSCSSVTLAWMGTEERSLYCLYQRRIQEQDKRADTDRCLGPESRPATERILCKYFQELNPRRAVTTAVIGGLEPSTVYVFDVYLLRRWGLPIKYHSKTVRTRREC